MVKKYISFLGSIFLIFCCVGLVIAQEKNNTKYVRKEILLPKNSFGSNSLFNRFWNYSYPWGDDHNGTAKMKSEQVKIVNGELVIEAKRLGSNEGKSSKDPYLPISYYSGAIASKKLIRVDDTYPFWKIEGDFKAPTVAGSWPAFWITGSEDWPPESDILEFKGDDILWQNTVKGPDWQHTDWQTQKTAIPTAFTQWHHYAVTMEKKNRDLVELKYYINGRLTATHLADFFNKPFYLIINLQMEGASGELGSGPESTTFKAKNVAVTAYANKR
jgi:beta-glucanase (GH16 family)